MKAILFWVAVGAILAPGAVTLRYQYKKGQTMRFQLKERVVSSTRSGSVESPTGSQETNTEIEMRVVSSSGGKAVVEELVKAGRASTASQGGLGSESASPASKRRITYGSRGEVLKWERLPVAGVPSPPGFLEGLAVPLPEHPVAIGDVWAGYTSARGIDGKSIQIKYNSRYSGNGRAAGHPCAIIETILVSAFSAVQPQTNTKMPGTITGKMTSYFATDIGQDVKGEAEITVELKQSAELIHKLKTYASQTLIK